MILKKGNKVIVRPSGTEPKVKVYLFTVGESASEAECLADVLSSAMAVFTEIGLVMAKEKETYSLISVDVASEEEVVRVDAHGVYRGISSDPQDAPSPARWKAATE